MTAALADLNALPQHTPLALLAALELAVAASRPSDQEAAAVAAVVACTARAIMRERGMLRVGRAAGAAAAGAGVGDRLAAGGGVDFATPPPG